MDNYILRTKMLFTTTVLGLGLLLTVGVLSMRGSGIFTKQNFFKTYDYFNFKLAVNSLSSGRLAAAALGGQDYVSSDNVVTDDIPVLLYHGIVDKSDRFSLTKQEFWDHMFSMKKAGYRTITLDEFNDFIRNGKQVKGKVFVLTFDDGRLDSYVGADPVLKALGFTAVMFTPSDVATQEGRKIGYYLRKEDIQKMVATGRWEIESHAVQTEGGTVPVDAAGDTGNLLSNKMWLKDQNRLETEAEYEARVNNELSKSKADLEKAFGINVNYFAYPFGDYGQQSQNNIENAERVVTDAIKSNYSLAFKQVWPGDDYFTSNYSGDDPYHLHRIESGTEWTGDYLVNYIENTVSKKLPYADDISPNQGWWKKTWGMMKFEDTGLVVSSTPTSTGSFVFLDGTRAWQNYLYTTDVFWNSGSHISLVSGYRDANNYVSCTFSKDNVRIENYVNGEPTKLAQEKNNLILPASGEVVLGMSFANDTVKCYVGQTVITVAKVPSYAGGVGVKGWDEAVNNSSFTMKSMEVVPVEQTETLRKSLPTYERAPEPVVEEKPAETKEVQKQKEKKQEQEQKQKDQKVESPQSVAASTTPVSTDLTLPYSLNTSDPNIVSNDEKTIGSWDAKPNRISVSGSSLIFAAEKTYTTAATILRGGWGWRNYSFFSLIEPGINSRIIAVARYKDSKNFISCEYQDNGNTVMLVNIKDGKRYLMNTKPDPAADPTAMAGDRTIGVQVQGTAAGCLGRDGKLLFNTEVADMPEQGSVGYRIYSPSPGMASITIKSANVNAL